MGFVGYYKRFFKANGEQFAWREEQENAFLTLQTMMVEVLVITYPDYSKEYVLDTDDGGDSSALSQNLERKKRVVACYIKTFSGY